MLRRMRTAVAICLAAFGCATAFAHAAPRDARVVAFSTQRWTTAAGGDGAMRALVVVESALSWYDARDLAESMGARLTGAQSSAELALLESMSDFPGAFDCGGPWLGGFREPQSPWYWSDGLPVAGFGWKPFRPAQSTVFPAAIQLSGIDGPDGRWTDAFPDTDAGVSTRSALVQWRAFVDCDGDDLPDLLEIAANPALDADADGRLDACAPPNPADINGDGRVDAADIAALLNAWGTSAASADTDGSGVVDAADLTTVLSAWTGG